MAESNSVRGIDAAGDVLVSGFSGCADGEHCYTTYTDGVATSRAATAGLFRFDNGTSCIPSIADARVFYGACNSGREAFAVLFDSPSAREAFTNSDPLAYLVSPQTAVGVVINSSGDVAWTDGFSENLYEAVDLTPDASTSLVPEPGSALLVATGMLSMFGLMRARRRGAKVAASAGGPWSQTGR